MKSRTWALSFLSNLLINVMPKSPITDQVFETDDGSTIRIVIEPEEIRPTPGAAARYFGGPRLSNEPGDLPEGMPGDTTGTEDSRRGCMLSSDPHG